MADGESPSLGSYLADALVDRADELVEEWITWVTEEVRLRPARHLPREAIRNYIPPTIRELADFLRTPIAGTERWVESELRSHARLRYDQGYDIDELLREYEGLESIMSRIALEALETYPGDTNPMETARVFLRLRDGLRAILSITVSTYRRADIERRRDLHRNLEDYVRTIGHELKNPLHSIGAGVGMLAEDHVATDTAERERYVEVVRRGIRRALELLEDVRTLALTEGAAAEREWKPLHSIVESVFAEVEDLAEKKGVRLEIDEPLGRISVDAMRVEIALVNLLANAIKYSDPKKKERWARVSARPSERKKTLRWEIRVADNGLGIPEEMQAQIFERRFRAHPHVAEGTGLGLAIARQVVEQAGGQLDFESKEGEGSTFSILVPAHESEG